MYLLKYLAHCGVASRRKAEELIKRGLVTVNGTVVTTPFVLVGKKDVVSYEGKVVNVERNVYVLLNKPKGYLTTCSDDLGRKTIMELVANASNARLYPVGRLDRMTTGVLLLTNNGELAQKLSHPRENVSKVYRVLLDKPLAWDHHKKIENGFDLEDGFIQVDACRYYDKRDKRDILVKIHSGRYRIIRRLFMALGYDVEKLDRVEYAGLSASGLQRGEWRYLSADEVQELTNF
jgi:23S rRNA pseudouridine2605 synthase